MKLRADSPDPYAGYVERPNADGSELANPTAGPHPDPAVGLPSRYAPRVAGYARGPWLDPATVTPSDWRWKAARTYTVENAADGQTYRAIRVTSGLAFIGYWAVELLGTPLVESITND